MLRRYSSDDFLAPNNSEEKLYISHLRNEGGHGNVKQVIYFFDGEIKNQTLRQHSQGDFQTRQGEVYGRIICKKS
ncbi:MAG: hypothetical protein K9H16_13050 [Bacteroidales bacterium]|nr:hypothetical protein [Bacteroidales bacterium]